MAKSRTAAGGAAGARTGRRERRVGWWQRPLSWVLLVLACLAAPVAVLAGWARWDLLDGDRYVRTIQPIATEPAVQDAVIAIAGAAFGAGPADGNAGGTETGQAIAAVPAASPATDAEATPPLGNPAASDRATPTTAATSDAPTSDATPGGARPAALPRPPQLGERASGGAASRTVRQAANRAASEAVAAVVRSPAFAEEWADANRAAHAALTDPAAAGQPVAIDFSPLAARVAERLGPRAGAALPDPAALQVEVLDAAAADRLRGVLHRIGWVGIALPVAAVLLATGAIWVAPGRLAALRRLGFGVVLTTAAVLLALLVAATGFAGRVAGPAAVIVAAVVDAVLRAPLLWLAVLALAGLAVAVVGVAAGWLARDRARA